MGRVSVRAMRAYVYQGANSMTDDELRDDIPTQVYLSDADFVKLAMKRMTAKRVVGWLRDYAEYADLAGTDQTAADARNVANRLAAELPDEEVQE